jgi:serine protease AprX
MPKLRALLEIEVAQQNSFELFSHAATSPLEAMRRMESLVSDLSGFGVELIPGAVPIPMYSTDVASSFAEFASPETNADRPASSVVVAAELDRSKVDELRGRRGVTVFENPQLWLIDDGVDCSPFLPAVTEPLIQRRLGVDTIWNEGFSGEEVVVGILDAGVNGDAYPVEGGFSPPGAQEPGLAPITSHGSMCAADVLLAAPSSTLYDYPFLGNPLAGDALTMFQAVLEQRRRDGTPHLTTNSYGMVSVPPREQAPHHPIYDLNHPLHRKIREVVASGAPVLFAAGNCGLPCPSGKCLESSIGPGISIHGSNSLTEVITVAAVSGRGQRIGYSSQGPGMFDRRKPDIACYSHFFGNFGPGRPGGLAQPFDNGTSAATPVAAGVAALLISAFGPLTGDAVKEAFIAGAVPIGDAGWNPEVGFGVVSASRSYRFLLERNAG